VEVREVLVLRILGSGDFVDVILREAEERQLRLTRFRPMGKSIKEVVH